MEFNILDSTVSIIGKRKSGKSELTSYLLQLYHEQFDKIIIISGTESINQFYQKQKCIDTRFIYNEWDESLIESILQKMASKNKGMNRHNPKMKHILLVLDDICSSFNTHSSKAFEKLFTIGRHYGITTIVLQQYVNHIPPVARNNSDYIMVSQSNTQGLEILSTEFLFGNISKAEFKEMYLENTSNYGFLLISTNCASDNDNLDEIYGCIRVPIEIVNANKIH